MSIKLYKLNKTIIKCKKCPRLSRFIKKISKEKRKQNINEKYWGKPVTGFGKINAKLLILGLAPAAHGGTRTGRAFTGDKSGDFLFKCLHKAKISNQPFSKSLNDGLELNSTYITNIIKCVPPGDKPEKEELNNCSNYFNVENYDLNTKFKFIHGKSYSLPENIKLVACYHPSPRNVNTKLISEKMIVDLFLKAKKISKV